MAVVAETVGQGGLQALAHGLDVGEQVVFPNDALHLQRGGAGDGVRLIGLAVQEAARPGIQRSDDAIVDQNTADRLIAAAQALGDDLDVGGDAFLLPRVHGAGAAHPAHDLIQDQQRAVAVAYPADALEVAGQRRDAAGGGTDDGFGEERHHRVGAEAPEFRFKFLGQAIQVLGVRLPVVFEAVGEAGRDQRMGLAEDRFEFLPPHRVTAGRQGAEGGAVVGLAAGDGADALGLADFQEILAGELDRGLIALGARGAEPRAGEAAGFLGQDDIREVFGRLVGECAGVGVGHGGGLAADSLGDAAIAVTEACDGGTARGVDNGLPVGGVEIKALATDSDGRDGAGAMEDAGHCGVSDEEEGQGNARICASNRGRSSLTVVQTKGRSTSK